MPINASRGEGFAKLLYLLFLLKTDIFDFVLCPSQPRHLFSSRWKILPSDFLLLAVATLSIDMPSIPHRCHREICDRASGAVDNKEVALLTSIP